MRLFEKISDFPLVRDWYAADGLQIRITKLPEFGFIDEKAGAIFIYHDKSSEIGFIHGFVVNPKATKREIYAALKKFRSQITHHAQSRGIGTLVFSSYLPSLIRRSIRDNFVVDGKYLILTKEI